MSNTNSRTVIVENVGSLNGINGKQYKQIFMMLETINSNNRYYPKECFTRNYPKLQKEIEQKRLMGELDHPETNDPNRMQYIKLTEVSHLITSLELKDKTVYGTFVPLNTPNGVILQELLNSKVSVGISLRALGDVEEKYINGKSVIYIVPNTFDIITFDAVSIPGFDKQYVITESINYLKRLESRGKLNSFEEYVLVKYIEKLKRSKQKRG